MCRFLTLVCLSSRTQLSEWMGLTLVLAIRLVYPENKQLGAEVKDGIHKFHFFTLIEFRG